MSAQGVPVALRGTAKTFADGTRALAPLDLDISAGETVVFLGPSGCGKTTTLRIVAGLESPDPGGRVLFGERDVTALPIEKRRVGMVFQSYALFPNMNVADNVAYGLRVRGVPRAERSRRAGEIMEMMRIGELAARRIDQLSGGQRQRVALARALAPQPSILLLDEPLTALDAALREKLRTEIDALLRSLSVTAVYVTHDQEEAMALADRIVVMNAGRIEQIGTPRDIYHRPQSAFVAGFVGHLNLLPGAPGEGGFRTAAGTVPLSPRDEAGEVLGFRPEAARIVSVEEGSLALSVENVQFLGARQRAVLSGGPDLTVIVETDGRADFEYGQRVGLAIDPASIIWL